MPKKRKQDFDNESEDEDEEPKLTPEDSLKKLLKLYTSPDGKLIVDPVIQKGRLMERSDAKGRFQPASSTTEETLNLLVNSDLIEEGIKKDYEERKTAALEKRATSGDVSAMNALGNMLMDKGEPDDAFHSFVMSACRGDKNGMFSAAECLIPNDELKKSMKRETLGLALLVSSAEKGNAEACLKLGRIFYAQKKSTCKHFAQYFLTKIFQEKWTDQLSKEEMKEVDEILKGISD